MREFFKKYCKRWGNYLNFAAKDEGVTTLSEEQVQEIISGME
jgi:hypothetical protein